MRLGLSLIGRLAADAGQRIAAARPFRDVANLARRARLDRESLEALAAGGALAGLAGHRRQAAWAVAAAPLRQDLLIDAPTTETTLELPSPSEGEEIVADYASLRLSLGRHPLMLLRGALAQQRYLTAADIRDFASNRPARCAGIVTGRQRPGNAQVVFVTLEDESGFVNVIVHPRLAERQRRRLLASRLLGVLGVVQREGEVIHLIAKRLVDHTPLLGRLPTSSRDFSLKTPVSNFALARLQWENGGGDRNPISCASSFRFFSALFYSPPVQPNRRSDIPEAFDDDFNDTR